MLIRYFLSLCRRATPFLSIFFILCLAAQAVLAHPLNPDLTVVQLKIHYDGKALTARIQGPASDLVIPAKVDPSALDGEKTKREVLNALQNQLKTTLLLEADGKTLSLEAVDSPDYQNINGGQYTLEATYPITVTPHKMRVTSKFTHTIVTCNGNSFEMHNDKETSREFETNFSLNNLFINMLDFIIMGAEHLFTGPDHILFICTLIFALMDLRSVVKMLTGFTIGHTTTLILTTLGFFSIPMHIADMCIALTIVYVGLENIFTKEMPKYRFWVVTAFGLVHGMAFSTNLKEIGLPQQGLILCLLSFNLGLEIAQVIIVSAIYPALSYLRRYKEFMFEEAGKKQFRQLMNLGSATTACIGLYWFIERAMGR